MRRYECDICGVSYEERENYDEDGYGKISRWEVHPLDRVPCGYCFPYEEIDICLECTRKMHTMLVNWISKEQSRNAARKSFGFEEASNGS